MTTTEKAWAGALSVALKAYCDEHGYAPRMKLARKLKISQSIWDGLTRGDRVVIESDPDVYAVLFFELGLKEADPRAIPGTFARSGRPRAWLEEKYRKWEAERRGVGGEVIRPPDRTGFPTLGAALDAVLREYPAEVRALRDEVRELKTLIQALVPGQGSGDEVEETLLRLHALLKVYWQGTTDQRDAFYEEYGRMARLVYIRLEGLTRSARADRERAVEGEVSL